MDDKISKSQIEVLIESIKSLKKIHKKYALGVVDIDNAFLILLEGFQITKNQSKDI